MKVEVSETIAVERSRLFSTVTEFEAHLRHWARGVLGVTRESGALGPGTKFTITGRNIGFQTKVRWDYTVTAYEPPYRFAGRAQGGPVPFEEEFRLEEVEGGTRITLIQDLRPSGQFKLASPLLSAAWSRLLQQNLRRLKKRAETSKAAAA